MYSLYSLEDGLSIYRQTSAQESSTLTIPKSFLPVSFDFRPSGFASNQPKQLVKPLDDFHLAEPKVLSS